MLSITVTGQWRVTRANGESVTIEGESEREAELLARESFPGERFTIALTSQRCMKCGATFGADLKACPACRERREARKRVYLAHVAVLLKGGWKSWEGRVRAFGVVGAAAVATREAKRAVVKPRARITEVKVTVIS